MPYKNKADKKANGIAYRHSHPERCREYQRRYRARGGKKKEWKKLTSDPPRYAKHLESRREYRRKLRQRALDMYGGACTCCNSTTFEFLAFHHINRDGHLDRKISNPTTDFYLRLLKCERREDIQVLCHNCHMAITYYGYCPHKQSV